jgi:hypothetical protein
MISPSFNLERRYASDFFADKDVSRKSLPEKTERRQKIYVAKDDVNGINLRTEREGT